MWEIFYRSWYADCVFDESNQEWKRLEVTNNRISRDKPGIVGNFSRSIVGNFDNNIIVAGGTISDERGQKRRTNIVELLVKLLT
jgi:N-acetylneuraminic acid mutarotase